MVKNSVTRPVTPVLPIDMLFKNNLLKGRLKANSKLNLSVNLLFSLIAAFSSDTTYRVPGIASHTFMFTFRQAISLKKLYIMHQSIPPAPSPPPPPQGYCGCGAFVRLVVSPGGGTFANFAPPGGRAFAKPRAIPELFTRTRFPIRI